MKIISQYKGLRRELYVLFLCRFIDNAGSMVGPMLTLILSTKMGMDAGSIAAFFLVYTAISLPIQLLGGKLTDKVNKKLLINVCDISSSVIYVICGIIGLNYVTLCVYLLGGLLQTIEGPAYESLVSDFTTSDDREKAYSLEYLGLNLGLVLSPTLGSILIKNHIGLMFVLSGIFEFLSIIIFDIFVRDISAVTDSGNIYEKGVDSKSSLRILRDSKVLIPFTVISSFGMLFYGMYGYIMPLSFTAVHGDIGSVYFGTVSSLNCITVLVFTAMLTALFARRSTLGKIIIGSFLELAGLSMIYLFLGTPLIYYIGIVIFTWGEILNTIASTPYLSKRIPINYRGRIMAITSVISSIICSVGEYGVGKIFDVNMDAAWITILALGAAVIVGYVLLRNPDKKAFPALYDKNAPADEE